MTTSPLSVPCPFDSETPAADSSIDLAQLEELISQALQAKLEAERQKTIYDSLREQICCTLRDLGETKLEGSSWKVRLKETKSGWSYSDETEALASQLSAQQALEKKIGIAKPAKVTISADVFAL